MRRDFSWVFLGTIACNAALWAVLRILVKLGGAFQVGGPGRLPRDARPNKARCARVISILARTTERSELTVRGISE